MFTRQACAKIGMCQQGLMVPGTANKTLLIERGSGLEVSSPQERAISKNPLGGVIQGARMSV